MSCCCPEKNFDDKSAPAYDDLKSGASAPTTQSMKRDAVAAAAAADDGSDARAVDWWRTRSQDTNQSSRSSPNNGGLGLITPDRSSSTTLPMQLTPEEEYSWANGVRMATSPSSEPGAGDRMATIESIEVDELSAVREELKRRENIQDYILPHSNIPMRAPSIPVERSRTEDSGVTDESSLQFKLVEHEEEEDVGGGYSALRDEYEADTEDGEGNRAIHSPAKIERKVSPHHSFAGSSLHDLRHKNTPMVDADVAADYLAAADNSVDVDINSRGEIQNEMSQDSIDQIIMGVRNAMPRDSPGFHREDSETNRVEDILTGRKRKSPNNNNAAGKYTVASMGRHAMPPPGREPVSPKRPPTPEEAAAAAAAAASQIRAPSPFRSSQFQTRESDSLSNVPSNVDSDTRERYLMACRLLKATMIQKDSRLRSEDKEFLRDLLSNAEQTRDPSDYDIAAIETASDILSHEEEIIVPQAQDRLRVLNIKEAWRRKAQELFASRPANTPGLTLPEPKTPTKRPTAASSPRSLALAAGGPKEKTPSPRSSPFVVLGRKPTSPNGVLTPPLMEALRGFFPYSKVEENFWLKYSLNEHGGTLHALLSRVKDCKHTVIGVETKNGHIFGAFCSSSWRVQPSWFGSGECFLWRLKRSRLAGGGQQPNYEFDNEMEVYPYTGHDEQIQYCTERTLAVGGGEWSLTNGIADTSPHQDEPQGIAFMLDGDLMGGETNSCATFANPRLCGKDSGSNEFDIVGLEVWTLTPCLTVSEAQNLEAKRAFVEQNTIVYNRAH